MAEDRKMERKNKTNQTPANKESVHRERKMHPLNNPNYTPPEGFKINRKGAVYLGTAGLFALSSLGGGHRGFAGENIDTSALKALGDRQQEVPPQTENIQPEAIEIITPTGELRVENYEEGNSFFVYIEPSIQRAAQIFNDFTSQNNLEYPSYRLVLLADISQENGHDVATPTPTPVPTTQENSLPIFVSVRDGGMFIPGEEAAPGEYLGFLNDPSSLPQALRVLDDQGSVFGAAAEKISQVHIRPSTDGQKVEAFDLATQRVFAEGTPNTQTGFLDWEARLVFNTGTGEFEEVISFAELARQRVPFDPMGEYTGRLNPEGMFADGFAIPQVSYEGDGPIVEGIFINRVRYGRSYPNAHVEFVEAVSDGDTNRITYGGDVLWGGNIGERTVNIVLPQDVADSLRQTGHEMGLTDQEIEEELAFFSPGETVVNDYLFITKNQNGQIFFEVFTLPTPQTISIISDSNRDFVLRDTGVISGHFARENTVRTVTIVANPILDINGVFGGTVNARRAGAASDEIFAALRLMFTYNFITLDLDITDTLARPDVSGIQNIGIPTHVYYAGQ